MARRKNSYQDKEIRKGGKSAIDINSDKDTNECTSELGSKSLNHSLEQLYEKRGPTREAALSSIITSYRLGYQYQFSEKNFSELLYQCLKSFKRGSIKENCSSLEVLGLLAITIGCGEKSRQLYKEAGPVLSEALNNESQPQKLKLILDTLAIITFVGGNELDDTERSMQVIWNFMHSKSVFKEAQSVAICSWSLLLSTMDSWTLSYKHWRGAIPFFKNLLESEHQLTVKGAREAVSLIFELGCIEKFGGDRSAMEEINILEDGHISVISVKIGKQRLRVNALPQQIQLNYMRRLLGFGFVLHMKENELLHDVFKFKPEKRQTGRELYVAERVEVAVNLFVPDVREVKTAISVYISHRTRYL